MTAALRPLAFVDTETTGLSLDDDIWDFAVITRVPGQPDVETQFYVEHDLIRAAQLPEPFRADHDARYNPATAMTRHIAAHHIGRLLDRAIIIGAVPSFDTTRIEWMRMGYSLTPAVTWHYQVIDVETLIMGYKHGIFAESELLHPGTRVRQIIDATPLPPWDSHILTASVGVKGADEHTALGDARWARDAFDAVNPWPEYARVHIDAIDVVGR